MDRRPGLSVRLKLTLSYAGFLIIASLALLGAVWVFLLRGRFVAGTDDLRTLFSNVLLLQGFGPAVFVPAAVLVFAFLLIFGLVGGWFLAGRMLAPLDRVTEAARLAADGSLGHRIRLPGRRDEFRELADAFDTMLARLEAQVEEQQRFAANASHELRTPLAITATLLDVAQADPDRDTSELIAILRRVNGRAIDLTEALLLLGRAERGGFSRDPVDLSLLAEEAVETLLPLAERRGVAIELTGDVAVAAGSRALVLQLITNLVHNAIVHNVAGDPRVTIRTSADSGQAVLIIENTGPSLGAGLVATLTEPFQRGTGRVRGDHAGVGLGLAIARSIVAAHGGTLALRPRAGGGLLASVELPEWSVERAQS
ncbi:sensor histidine kinase [Naumannella huperziae]